MAVHEIGDCADAIAECPARPVLAIGPDPANRRAQLVYLTYAAEGLRVRTSRDGGKTFGPARTALAGGHGSVTVGSDGRLHAVALDGSSLGGYGSANHRIQYTASTDGGRTFARPITISRRDEMLPFYFATPALAVDARRRWTYVVYVRGGHDAVWDLVLAASKDGGATWQRTRIGDAPACAIHLEPAVAVDPTTGRLHLAWYDSRGAPGRFAHASCGPGATKCTQLGRLNDVPFGALSTVRHGATWLGAAQSLVIDDRRRTLHAVWTQPVDEGGLIISRIFHAKAKLR
ncbi:MAG: exo-alpha-sialidase [Deltaproteobacteria bacterium]|nr:exo-alpha-sialidase [Deltaproteobacteria bacterium]